MPKNFTPHWAIAQLQPTSKTDTLENAGTSGRVSSFMASARYDGIILLHTPEMQKYATELNNQLVKREIPTRVYNLNTGEINHTQGSFRRDMESYISKTLKGVDAFTVFIPPADAFPKLLELLQFVTEEEVEKGFVIPFGSLINIQRLQRVKNMQEIQTLGPELVTRFGKDLK